MAAIVLSILNSFIIAFLIIPVIIKFTKRRKKYLDKPGRRKIHKEFTPSMGGVALFFGFIISFLIWSPLEGIVTHIYTIAALLIIFILGLRDDIITLRPINKLVGQLIAASIIIALTGTRLIGLYGLFGIYAFPEWLSYLLTAFTIVVITNSFNLIDGLDGLAGTIAVISLSFFGVWFVLIDQLPLAILNFSMLGAVVAFLTYNWEPSKIFMGDTGALFLGFFFAVMAIYFINYNYVLPDNNPFKFEGSVSTAACIVIIPLFDTLRIFILRTLKKRSPFSPDKNHLHHALMRLGVSHSGTAIILGFVNIVFITIAIVLNDIQDSILFAVVIGVAIVISVIIDNLILRKLRPRRA